MITIPILAVLAAKVMTQGVVVHRLQQPVPVVLLHVTYRASSDDDDDDDNVVDFNDDDIDDIDIDIDIDDDDDDDNDSNLTSVS